MRVLAAGLPARADGLEDIHRRGSLTVAVYNDFAPFSSKGKGIDVELGEALGRKLGLATQVIGYNADEDMDDDLRNMVWKGHYLRGDPANVMMRVPVDPILAKGAWVLPNGPSGPMFLMPYIEQGQVYNSWNSTGNNSGLAGYYDIRYFSAQNWTVANTVVNTTGTL